MKSIQLLWTLLALMFVLKGFILDSGDWIIPAHHSLSKSKQNAMQKYPDDLTLNASLDFEVDVIRGKDSKSLSLKLLGKGTLSDGAEIHLEEMRTVDRATWSAVGSGSLHVSGLGNLHYDILPGQNISENNFSNPIWKTNLLFYDSPETNPVILGEGISFIQKSTTPFGNGKIIIQALLYRPIHCKTTG